LSDGEELQAGSNPDTSHYFTLFHDGKEFHVKWDAMGCQSPSFTMARYGKASFRFSGTRVGWNMMEPQVRESLVAGAIVGRDGPMLQVLPPMLVDALTRPPWQAGKSQ